MKKFAQKQVEISHNQLADFFYFSFVLTHEFRTLVHPKKFLKKHYEDLCYYLVIGVCLLSKTNIGILKFKLGSKKEI